MYVAILILHLLICIALVGVVLIQSGKGGGLAGGAFGGSAQTVFGGRGATDFVTRATMILGTAFFITSLTLALMSSGVGRTTRSLIQTEAQRPATSAAPAAPGREAPSPIPAGEAEGGPSGGTTPRPAGESTPSPASGGP